MSPTNKKEIIEQLENYLAKKILSEKKATYPPRNTNLKPLLNTYDKLKAQNQQQAQNAQQTQNGQPAPGTQVTQQAKNTQQAPGTQSGNASVAHTLGNTVASFYDNVFGNYDRAYKNITKGIVKPEPNISAYEELGQEYPDSQKQILKAAEYMKKYNLKPEDLINYENNKKEETNKQNAKK